MVSSAKITGIPASTNGFIHGLNRIELTKMRISEESRKKWWQSEPGKASETPTQMVDTGTHSYGYGYGTKIRLETTKMVQYSKMVSKKIGGFSYILWCLVMWFNTFQYSKWIEMADPIPTGHRNFGAPNSAKRRQIRVNHGLGDVFDENDSP